VPKNSSRLNECAHFSGVIGRASESESSAQSVFHTPRIVGVTRSFFFTALVLLTFPVLADCKLDCARADDIFGANVVTDDLKAAIAKHPLSFSSPNSGRQNEGISGNRDGTLECQIGDEKLQQIGAPQQLLTWLKSVKRGRTFKSSFATLQIEVAYGEGAA